MAPRKIASASPARSSPPSSMSRPGLLEVTRPCLDLVIARRGFSRVLQGCFQHGNGCFRHIDANTVTFYQGNFHGTVPQIQSTS